MKEGIRSAVTMMPLSRPTRPPLASPVRMPSAGEPVVWITVPARQADSATLAPTERSRPAVSTTSVRPEAMKKVRLALAEHVEDVAEAQERIAEHGEHGADQERREQAVEHLDRILRQERAGGHHRLFGDVGHAGS